MKYLPFENITFTTNLKEEEVIRRLNGIVEPSKVFRTSIFRDQYEKAYKGKIEGCHFKIKRVIYYRNSFLPIIKGSIQQDFGTTIIAVKMRLPIFVMIFMCFWCCIPGFICIVILILSISKEKSPPAPALIPFVMVLFAYLMTIFFFKKESTIAIKDLQKTFDAEIR